jgi:signal transduction histidine kinase
VRRRILLTVAAATGLVLLAFLLPLAVLVQDVAQNRATNAATITLQPLVALVPSVDERTLRAAVDQFNATSAYPITVFLPDGTVIGEPAPVTPSVRLAATGRSLTADVPDGREILVAVEGLPQGTAVLRAYVPTEELTEGVRRARIVLVVLGLILLGLGLLVGDSVARSFLRPVRNLADTADALAAGDLQARATPGGPHETQAVAQAMNRMAERIRVLLATEREAVADLSHRLRTPVTALRLDVEAVDDPTDRARLQDDVAGLSRAVDDVIREARRPVREGMSARCDAVTVVAERCRFWSVLAEDTDRAMSLSLPPDQVPVGVTADDLGYAVDALLGNVFAHTGDGVGLVVDLQPRPGGGAVLVVTDQGPGWPSSAPTDVLGRGVSGGGSTGLGLDIARRTAEASGGALRLGSAQPHGAVVGLELGPP